MAFIGGLIILIAFMLILILTVVMFGILILRKKRLQLKFVMPDKSIAVKNVNGKVTREQTFMSGIYFVDDACMLKKFWGNEIWYYYGNPNPINFNFDKNMNNIIGTKAQDLKTFHDSDLITKLFSTENIEKLLMILMFVNIGIGVVCIIVTVVMSGKAVELSNSGNNTMIIAHAVKQALTNPAIV
jgi:hypothetical protein